MSNFSPACRPRPSRRLFLVSAVAAAVRSFVGVQQRACAQEHFDLAAVDESLTGHLLFYARQSHDGDNAGLYEYDFKTRLFKHIQIGVYPEGFCRASPDGKSFAVAQSSDGLISAWLYGSVGRTQVSDLRARLFWSADGRQVIFSEWTENPLSTKTWQMHADGTGRVQLPVPKDELVVDWSPDGRSLLIVRRNADAAEQLDGGPDKPIFIRGVDGSGPRLLLEKNPAGSGLARFSPDSKSVAYVRINHRLWEYGVRIIDVATRRERQVMNGNGQDDPVGSSRVDLQACKLEYSIVSPK